MRCETLGEGSPQYSMAFLIRWCNTLLRISESPVTTGKGSWVTVAHRSRDLPFRREERQA